MGPGGALEYLQEAREQGLVKYIGVTGHDVAIARMHQRSLERFDFDSVLLPYNYLMMQKYRAGFGEFAKRATARCRPCVTRRPYLGRAQPRHGTSRSHRQPCIGS